MDVSARSWPAQKKIYRVVVKKAAIKEKATGGKDLFGSANEATEEDTKPPIRPNSMHTMKGYFNNLTAAAMNENQVLEEMDKAMSKITETNEVLNKTNAGLTHQLTVMKNWKCPSGPTGLSNPNPRGGPHHVHGEGTRQPVGDKRRKLCLQCKQGFFHNTTNCFELIANAVKRPNNWTSHV